MDSPAVTVVDDIATRMTSAAETRDGTHAASEGEGRSVTAPQSISLTAKEKKTKNILVLFDLDGTLAPHRQPMEEDMHLLLRDLKNDEGIALAVVSGSDEVKMREQLQIPDMFDLFEYVFCENGCVVYNKGILLQQRSLSKELGEDNLKRIINYALHYIADLDIPIKRGTFVEYRHGVLNISPIGRNCSASERLAFAALDEKLGIRIRMQQVLEKEFSNTLNLTFSLGGQISLDCFPKFFGVKMLRMQGWDKRLCLPYLTDYQEIHFFGDRTQPGGNDYEVFHDERTIGHAVTAPADTIRLLQRLFLQNKLQK